jgi:hypothetical protein
LLQVSKQFDTFDFNTIRTDQNLISAFISATYRQVISGMAVAFGGMAEQGRERLPKSKRNKKETYGVKRLCNETDSDDIPRLRVAAVHERSGARDAVERTSQTRSRMKSRRALHLRESAISGFIAEAKLQSVADATALSPRVGLEPEQYFYWCSWPQPPNR